MVRSSLTSVNYTPDRAIYINGVYTPVPVSYFVLHTEQGYENGTVSWFRNPASAVSSNYGVALNGDIDVIVDEGNTAWTNGNFESNSRSITIECEDNSDPQHVIRPDAQYESVAKLVADGARRYGLTISRETVKGHYEIPPHTHPDCPGDLDIDRVVARATEIYNILTAPLPEPTTAIVEYHPWNGQVKIINAVLNVRVAPTSLSAGSQANTPDGMLHTGMLADVVGWGVGEDPYGDGRNKWYKSFRNKWFWAGGTSIPNPTVDNGVPVSSVVPQLSETPPVEIPTVVVPVPVSEPIIVPDPPVIPTAVPGEFATTMFDKPETVVTNTGSLVIDITTGEAVSSVPAGKSIVAVGYVLENDVHYLHTAKMSAKTPNLGLPATDWEVVTTKTIQDIKPPAPIKPTLNDTLKQTESGFVRFLLRLVHLIHK